MRHAIFLLFALGLALSLSTKNEGIKSIKNAAECIICQGVAYEAIKGIESNVTEAELERLMQKACSIVPSAGGKQKCNQISLKLLNSLEKMFPFFLKREDYNAHSLCTMIDFCSVPCCISNEPEQVHIALAGDSIDSMSVSWVTAYYDTSSVYWGTDPNNLNNKAVGSNYTYTSGGWVGVLHKAMITGLSADTKYYYKVGGSKYGMSKLFNFRTFPSKASSWKFAVIGDMGVDPESLNTVKDLTDLVQNDQIDVLVHSGDISYADGYQARWDQYMRRVEPIVANLPYMVCPGNHEIMPLNELGLYGYKYRFLMPGVESGSNSNTFYSWNYGPVHWIAINSESVLDTAHISDEELSWIQKDLAKAVLNRKQQPWIAVYLHRPLYCTNTDKFACGIEASELRDYLEDLFYNSQVDFVITAHKHDYERTTSVYKQKPYPNGKAPMYVVNGAGGNREGVLHFPPNPPKWSANRVSEWGYGTIEVTANSFTWKYIIASNVTVADEVTLTK